MQQDSGPVRKLTESTLRPLIRTTQDWVDALYRGAEIDDLWQRRLCAACYAQTLFCDRVEYEERVARHFVAESVLAFAEYRALYVTLGDTEPHVIYDHRSTIAVSAVNEAIFEMPRSGIGGGGGTRTKPISDETVANFERAERSLRFALRRYGEITSSDEAEKQYAQVETALVELESQSLLRGELERRLLPWCAMRRALSLLEEQKANLFDYMTNTMLLFARCIRAQQSRPSPPTQASTDSLHSMYVDLVTATATVLAEQGQ